MPIDYKNYPEDWKETSVFIRFHRAGGQCECFGECGHDHNGRCGAKNGQPHPITGSKVVLTVAHLGIPVQLPFHLHVTGITQADEIVKFVGFGVFYDAEEFERNDMMNNGTLSEFLGISSAMSAGLIVSFPSTSAGFLPRGAIVSESPASPVWIRVSSFDLLDEPFHSAFVPTETSTFGNPVPRDFIRPATHLADCISESSLADAKEFIPASGRASFPFISRLSGCKSEDNPANRAFFFSFAMTGSATYTGTFLPSSNIAAEFVAANGRTRLALDGVCRCWENVSANYTGLFGGADSWSAHVPIIPYMLDVDRNPQNRDEKNMRAMCQKCHLTYDAKFHARNAATTRHGKKLKAGQLELIKRESAVTA